MLLLPAYVYVSPGTNVKLNCSIFLDNSTIKNPVEWHFLSNERNQTRPEHIHIEEEFVNHSLISYLIIQHAQISHSGLWSCKYKRQRRTAKLIVDRDIQRMNALLANQSNRLFSSFLFCLFFVNIVFLSQWTVKSQIIPICLYSHTELIDNHTRWSTCWVRRRIRYSHVNRERERWHIWKR